MTTTTMRALDRSASSRFGRNMTGGARGRTWAWKCLRIAAVAALVGGALAGPVQHPASAKEGGGSNSLFQLVRYPASGQVVDPDNRTLSYGFLGYQSLNDEAVLAIVAGVRSSSDLATKGVFIWNGAALTSVSEVAATENFKVFDYPAINNRGDAVFSRSVLDGPSGVRFVTSYSDGASSDLVHYGDEIAPGFVVIGLPTEPTINERGEIAILVTGALPNGGDSFRIYKYTGGEFVEVLGNGHDAPGGGRFLLNYGPTPRVWLADNGDILFKGYVLGGTYNQMDGLFVVRADGTVEKVEIRGDPLPVGGEVHYYSLGNGSLNAVGDAVFRVRVEHPSIDSGIFVSSRGELSAVMYEGQMSPLGGPFLSLYEPTEDDPQGDGAAETDPPLMNARGQVLFKAKARDREGKARVGLFLGSPSSRVKVVATGDRLPHGGEVVEIIKYSLNERGQVAFEVRERTAEGRPQAVVLATPMSPEIASVKLKGAGESTRLTIKGRGFVIDDAVVEIDGRPAGVVEYAAPGGDGTTRRLVVRGSELAELLPPGQSVEVTVWCPLTGLRSAPVSLTAPAR